MPNHQPKDALPALVRIVDALLEAAAISGQGVLGAVAVLASVDFIDVTQSAPVRQNVPSGMGKVKLTSGVQHAAGVPEEGTSRIVEVVAPARDGGSVVQDVAVALAVSRESVRTGLARWRFRLYSPVCHVAVLVQLRLVGQHRGRQGRGGEKEDLGLHVDEC